MSRMKGSLKNLKKIMVSHRIPMLSLGKPKQKKKIKIVLLKEYVISLKNKISQYYS